ncbi:beta-amyrin 6-beta-monooxygenase-like [Apium graveolens]|uniref:beta-amyrin 6-beta-monooxygenase-like n=1 Tax=Apium graveolens TaxID=4045 RepID=UPI003D7C08ED
MMSLHSSMNESLDSWIIDSGATDHMTSNFTHLLQPVPFAPTQINLPTGAKTHISHMGTVKLNKRLTLKNVLYVPSFHHKLLSVPKLASYNNCHVQFYSTHCLIVDNATKELKGVGKASQGLYYLVDHLSGHIPTAWMLGEKLYSHLSQGSSSTALVAASDTEFKDASELDKWHHRLGHASIAKLKLIPCVQPHLHLPTKKSKANVPPGSSGWPVIGESIKFVLSGPEEFMAERTKKYSKDVFKTSLFGEKMAVFCGTVGNKFVFANETKSFASWWPLSVRKSFFFPEFSESSTDDISSLLFWSIHDILKPEALKQYIPIMDSMAREHVDFQWTGNEVVKVYPLLKEYTLAVACRILMGVDDVEYVTRLARHIALVNAGLFSVPIDLPGTSFNKGIKGGRLVRAELMKVITNKRKEMMENKSESVTRPNFLSRMLSLADENGTFVSEKVICNNIVGLLFASYETTSTAVTFVLKYLSELPHIYDEVYKEQMEIANTKSEGELLTWEDLQKMKYSWNVVCETLRLMPPALGGLREVTHDFEYAGFTIPKGWKTLWTVHTTHKDPKYFADPETFDPSRFEGKGPAPFTYVPFGGGSRMCPGKEYARLEILVFLHNIVTKFKFEKVNPREKIVQYFLLVPMEGLPVRLIPHEM